MADEIVRQLGGEFAEREAAYAELLRREKEGDDGSLAEIVVACVSPLCEVLCKDVQEVSAEEYIKASLVLTAISGVAPSRVGSECLFPNGDQRKTACDVCVEPNSALGVVRAKDPTALTPDDALLLSCPSGYLLTFWSCANGVDALLEAAAATTSRSASELSREFLKKMFETSPQGGGYWGQILGTGTGDDFCPLVVQHLLDMFKGRTKLRESHGEFALVGVVATIAATLMNRPTVAAELLELGVLDNVMQFLKETTPEDMVCTANFTRRPHFDATWIVKELIGAAQQNGTDLTAELLSSGFIDTMIDCLKAVEKAGPQKVQANHVVFMLMILNYLRGEALEQIDDKFRADDVKSAHRYLITNNVIHAKEFGLTTNTFGVLMAARLYGKDEDNRFGLEQGDIDSFLSYSMTAFDEFLGVFANIDGRGLRALCTSDCAKKMLLRNDEFVPHLIDGLLLHPDRLPKAIADANKADVQRDYAECIQQVSLFEPGLEALRAHPGMVEELELLLEQARTEDVKDSARKALATINGTKMQSISEQRAALQAHTVAKQQAESRARDEASLTGSARMGMEIERLRKQAEQARASGDIEESDAKLRQIEAIEQQVEAADEDWDEDLFKRVEQRSRSPPFKPGTLDDVARYNEKEMRATLQAMTKDVLSDDSATHRLVYHFTSLFSLDLIMANHGLRASVYGQLNGGLSVCLADPTELNWEQWSGNGFRERVGKELWGEKWKTLLRRGQTADGEKVEEGSDSDKIDYLIVLKVRKELVSDSSRILPGREKVCIIHRDRLTEIDGWHYLKRQHIAKIYRLSNPEQEAELTQKLIVKEEQQLENRHLMLSYEFGSEATMVRVNASLRRRGYNTWIAMESMKGADLDAVSAAIEQADALIIAVTNEYKESASCRLEATYAAKSEVDIIPLIVQSGYLAKGWLALLIGARMPYELHSASDDAAFEARIDEVARELGERGRPRIREAVPSERVSKPAPTRTSASAPTPAQTSIAHPPERDSSPTVHLRESIRRERSDFSPSMQTTPVQSSVESSAMMQTVPMQSSVESLAMIERLLEQQRHMMREQREEMEAKIEAKDFKLEKMQARLEPRQAISNEQLKALQLRVGKLQTDKLLPDDVAFTIEDLIADYIELESAIGNLTRDMAQANRGVANVCKLVALSERMELDQAFARQLNRKFG